MIFKSQQVNLDPEPYAHYYDRTDRSPFGNDLPGGLRTCAPRPEFEPTRDPLPWTDSATMRDAVQRPGLEWAPRREEFDTPVNRLLLEFRRLWVGQVDIVEQAAELAHNLGEHDYLWELQEDTDYTPDEVEHARRVLTRLARL